MKATQEQIQAWKAQYGEVFKISVGDKSCYLRKPSRKTMGYAAMASKDNPLKFNEVILDGCWIAGDEEIRTNDDLFMSVSAKVGKLIEIKEAELVKL